MNKLAHIFVPISLYSFFTQKGSSFNSPPRE